MKTISIVLTCLLSGAAFADECARSTPSLGDCNTCCREQYRESGRSERKEFRACLKACVSHHGDAAEPASESDEGASSVEGAQNETQPTGHRQPASKKKHH